METAKETLLTILRGCYNFYFRFTRISLFHGNSLIIQLTKDNCDDSYTTFKKGGIMGGVTTSLDFDESAMTQIQRAGLFRGMDSGFDFYLSNNGWHENSNTGNLYSIIYPIGGGGIDALVLVAEEDKIRLQIVCGSYTLLLCDPLTYSAS